MRISFLATMIIGLLALVSIPATANASEPGELYAWGPDQDGRVSDAPAGRFIAVAAGYAHNLAIDIEGQLHAWGNDEHGQVSEAPDGAFQAIAAGRSHSLAIDENGHLHAWGRDQWGQVSETPEGEFQAVATYFNTNYALDVEGRLHAWGWDTHGSVSDAPDGEFQAISAGSTHGIALDSDGTIHAWGEDTEAQVSDVPEGAFVAVAAGHSQNFAIDENGTIHAWGWDAWGSIEDVPEGEFQAIAAGMSLNIAIDTDGTLHVWGDDLHRQQRDAPEGPVIAVSAGEDHGVAIVPVDHEPADWLARAEVAMAQVDDPAVLAQLHAHLAVLYSRLDRPAEGVVHLEATIAAEAALPEPPERSRADWAMQMALGRFVQGLAREGEVEQARELVREHAGEGRVGVPSAEALEVTIAVARAEAGEVAEAMALLEAMEPEARDRNAIGRVGRVVAERNVDEALAIAEALEPGRDRTLALVNVAHVLSERGEIDRALAIAEELPDDDPRARGARRDAVRRAGQAAIAADDDERAEALIAHAALSNSDRASLHTALAVRRAERGDIERAYAAAEAVPEAGRAQALGRIGDVQLAAGDIEGALATAERFEGQAQARLMVRIVEAKLDAGELDAALALAEGMEHSERTDALAAVAKALATAGDVERAVAVAEPLPGAERRLLEVARQAIDAGHEDAASALLADLRQRPDRPVDAHFDRPGPTLHEHLDRLADRLEGGEALERRMGSLERTVELVRAGDDRRVDALLELFLLYVDTDRLEEAGGAVAELIAEGALPSFGIGLVVGGTLDAEMEDWTWNDALRFTSRLPAEMRRDYLAGFALGQLETVGAEPTRERVGALDDPADRAAIYVALAERGGR